jgi:hypothetical protein
MDRPDLVSRVQQRGRLHGPHESRRTLRAAIDALVEAVPVGLSRRLAMRVATETGAGLPESARTASCAALSGGRNRRRGRRSSGRISPPTAPAAPVTRTSRAMRLL